MTEKVDIDRLLGLVHRRWSIPVIAALYRGRGAKFVTLHKSLGVGRASLSATLAELIERGYVRRNTGHGHPMRPEYLLTRAGQALAPECERLCRLLSRRGELDIGLRKWSLPIVAAIGTDVRRFGEVQLCLPDASPRALTLGLKTLLGQRWVARSVVDEFPPSAGYALMPRGRSVLARVDALT